MSQELIDATQTLTSNKKGERLVSLKKIEQFLGQDEIIAHLCSKNEGKVITWTTLFIRIHNAILTDVDKASSKNLSLADKQLQMVQSIILDISQKSVVGDTPQLECATVVSCVLSVFESDYRMRYLGSIYTDLLTKYILVHRKFWGEIKLEHWIEMKNLCKTCFKNPPPNTQGMVYLDALADIIRLSYKNVLISQNLLDVFQFVSSIFSSCKSSFCSLGVSLLRLINILCLHMAVDFRYRVCSFMEDIFHSVIRLYERKKNNKNPLIYHFLIIYINVHNPNGVCDTDECFYAADEEKWRKQINSIYLLTQETTKLLLRDPEKMEIEVGFLDLVVEINHLITACGFDRILNIGINSDSDDYLDSCAAHSNKRKRSVGSSQASRLSERFTSIRNKHTKRDFNFFYITRDMQSSDPSFWLTFLELLLRKYPQILGTEYLSLMDILRKSLQDYRDPKTTQTVCRCLTIVLSKEKEYVPQTEIERKEINEIWNDVGVEIMRLFQTENSTDYHFLLRSLITNSKFRDTVPLINLYLRGTLPKNIESFLTLSALCQNCTLPESCSEIEPTVGTHHEKVENTLLKWIFEERIEYPTKELSKLLVKLILKKSEEENVSFKKHSRPLVVTKNINDFCTLIGNNYETVSLKNLRFMEVAKPNDESSNTESNHTKIDSRLMHELVSYLQVRCDELVNLLLDDLPLNEKMDAIMDSLRHCDLLMSFHTNLMNLNIEIMEWNVLLERLKTLLSLSTKRICVLLENNAFSLAGFMDIYSSNYHVDICKAIREKDYTDLVFLQKLFTIFQEKFRNHKTLMEEKGDTKENGCTRKFLNSFSRLICYQRSILHINTLKEVEKKGLEVVEVLFNFITTPGCLERNRFQKTLEMKLFEELMNYHKLDLNSKFHLQIVFSVIYNYSQSKFIDSDIMKKNLELLTYLFDSKSSDSEILVVIVQIMKQFIPLMYRTRDFDCESKFLLLVNGIKNTVFNKKRAGCDTLVILIELLAEIVKLDWKESSVFYIDKPEMNRICKEIITYLNHDSAEVRLCVARQIGTLFKLADENTEIVVDKQNHLMEFFKNTLQDLGNNTKENTDSPSVLSYHKVVSTSVTLISWASVVCLNDFWRRSALFHIIQAACVRKFDPKKVSRCISIICQELNIENEREFLVSHLSYLIRKWVEEGFGFEEFPHYLLGYQTTEEFLGTYFNILLPLYLWNGFFSVGNKISAKLHKSLKQVLHNCLPEIMAFILPSLSDNIKSDVVNQANKLKHFVDKELGEDCFEFIPRQLDKIIFRMFYYAEDKDCLNEFCGIGENLVEEFNSTRFTVKQITHTLQHASQNGGKSLLGEIALERPFIIQKVLNLLAGETERACVPLNMISYLYKYTAFVEILALATREKEFGSIVTYIMRDVIYTLISFIRHSDCSQISNMALKCIKNLLRLYILEYSDVVSEFLSVITILCKPLVLRGNVEALEVLKFLICDNSIKLQQAISGLDSFPTEAVFGEINSVIENNKRHWNRLEDEIRHFLQVSKSKRCSIEGLKHLRNLFTNRKEELKIMYNDLKMLRGFSEDCRKSLLHQLICALIELTGDDDSLMSAGAATCLAELGPLDLTTLVLKPENHYTKERLAESPQSRLLKSSVNALSELIINEKFEVRMAASDLLYVILATDDGNQVLKDEDPKIRSYLLPFVSTAERTLTIRNDPAELQNRVDQPQLWTPASHEDWITNLVTQLLKSFHDTCGVIEAMVEIVKLNWQFAERIFPILLDLIFSLKDPNRNEVVNRNIGGFFQECFDSGKQTPTSLNLKSVQCMVNVVDYIRIQRNYEGIYEMSDIHVNYLHVAEAARCCSAFFTAILYVELWFNEKKKSEDLSVEFTSELSVDKICELYPDEGCVLTRILRDCYSKIGIYDGVHGCGYMHLLEFATESRRYDHLNKWNISMLFDDIELSQGMLRSESRLMHSLHQYGMLYTVSNLIQSSKNKHELSDIQYKCASSLSNWNLFDNAYPWENNNNSSTTFEKSRYFALKAFRDGDQQSFLNEIHRARKCTINKLSSCSLESVQNLYQFLAELRCLKELEDFASSVKSPNVNELEALYARWCQQDNIKYSDFGLTESILAQRVTMIKEEELRCKLPEEKNFLHFMTCETYYKLIKMARKEKRYETAIRNLSYFSRLENVPESILGKVKLEKSVLEWETGDTAVGKFLLCHYLKRDELKGDLKSKALRIYGDWMASTNSENSRQIIENYYQKSIELTRNVKDRVNSYASLAKFSDSNYEQVKEYLSSPLFEIKKNIINRQQDRASELRQSIAWDQDREKKIAYRLVEKQSSMDENEIKNSENEKVLFLGLAIKYYLLSLKEGEKYDLLVFRLISLWFSNLDTETVTSQLREHLGEIPTYKFLCLLPQIVPRMAEIGLISPLVERCLKDHPHHTLPLLFALANSFEDAKYRGAKPTPYTQRALVARAMLEKFQRDQRLAQYISEMSQFCDAMIELANTTVDDGKTGKSGSIIKIPSKLKISRLNNLQFVAVPSLTIPFKKSCNYDDVVGISSFENEYQLVGGINLPKKIKCTGLDGISRSLLVKGKDDLRQDAVMQQVFTIMNLLLHRNSDTNSRKLGIRTYKVVPLSHRSGIIEWCDNTQPLSLYLIGPDGKSGAHKRFNPDDITALECRTMLRQTVGDVTNDVKLRVFLEICQRFRPAFRHFFIENFPEPGCWFERRLAYTYSVATSSMIGYILGIGDRHVHNILIDNATAEVIHIDLGIAFEQGKTLPSPETVPFRLTRDIVDGMGVSGVEGVFRLSCIKTMRVLRENQHTILTLLEVLLYDPLYAWTITAEKAFSVQGRPDTDSSTERNSSEIEINEMAERALIRLKQKLQGIETGGVPTNVEGQVNYLIQQARDPNNLCRLFRGWQAYL